MKKLQQYCVWMYVACVGIALPLVLVMVWTGEWYPATILCLETLGVLFVAGAAVLAILRMVTPPPDMPPRNARCSSNLRAGCNVAPDLYP